MKTITTDGTEIVGYGTYGSVRGYGPLRTSMSQAERDLRADGYACGRAGQGGYSDRILVAVDADGICWHVDWTRDPEGEEVPIYRTWVRRYDRAARYDLSVPAAVRS